MIKESYLEPTSMVKRLEQMLVKNTKFIHVYENMVQRMPHHVTPSVALKDLGRKVATFTPLNEGAHHHR